MIKHIVKSILIALLFASNIQTRVLCQSINQDNSLIVFKQRKGLFRIRKSVNFVESDSHQLIYREENKNHTLNKSLIKKIYTPNQIYLFKNNRFQYKTGTLMGFNFAGTYKHINANLNFSKRFQNKFDIGLGVGMSSNYFSIPTTERTIFVTIDTAPIYGFFKYRFNKGKRVFYAKGKLGYANHLKNFSIQSINNSFLLETKLGLCFSSRSRFKHYIEIAQSTSYANGKLNDREINNQPASIEFDVWLNNFTIGYGVEFGK